MRGTDDQHGQTDPRGRFIPARAGNSATRPARFPVAPVHPRSCGEQFGQVKAQGSESGSSPLVRGTGPGRVRFPDSARFIPARAGNRSSRGSIGLPDTVHPRSCGEQMANFNAVLECCGSSPLVRGTGDHAGPGVHPRRFIPARAGNSCECWTQSLTRPVHPRSCGEQSNAVRSSTDGAGSSPLVRGTDRKGGRMNHRFRFIPARAGNRRQVVNVRSHPAVHPRSCGEQHRKQVPIGFNVGSSPLVRGTVRVL